MFSTEQNAIKMKQQPWIEAAGKGQKVILIEIIIVMMEN